MKPAKSRRSNWKFCRQENHKVHVLFPTPKRPCPAVCRESEMISWNCQPQTSSGRFVVRRPDKKVLSGILIKRHSVWMIQSTSAVWAEEAGRHLVEWLMSNEDRRIAFCLHFAAFWIRWTSRVRLCGLRARCSALDCARGRLVLHVDGRLS